MSKIGFCTVFGALNVVLLRHKNKSAIKSKLREGANMKVLVSKINEKAYVQNTQTYFKDGKLAFVLVSIIQKP